MAVPYLKMFFWMRNFDFNLSVVMALARYNKLEIVWVKIILKHFEISTRGREIALSMLF